MYHTFSFILANISSPRPLRPPILHTLNSASYSPFDPLRFFHSQGNPVSSSVCCPHCLRNFKFLKQIKHSFPHPFRCSSLTTSIALSNINRILFHGRSKCPIQQRQVTIDSSSTGHVTLINLDKLNRDGFLYARFQLDSRRLADFCLRVIPRPRALINVRVSRQTICSRSNSPAMVALLQLKGVGQGRERRYI